eukprot:Tamp_03371.p1 GENE.Tamp_03371~~Tamp_03371.p1  ORF type:complete len:544 (+),score=69.72 Tamp_03371:1146-2777(+)
MFYLVAPCHATHQERTLKILGLWDELVAKDIPRSREAVWQDCSTWGEGVRMMLGTYPISDETWAALLKARISSAFKARPASEWEHMFGAIKVPGAAVQSTREWMHSAHAQASSLIVKRTIQCEDFELGPRSHASIENAPTTTTVQVLEANKVVWHSRSQVPMTDEERSRSRSALADRLRWACERGDASPTSVVDGGMRNGREWLSGVRVVDFCNVIAGPMIGCLLARQGATVLKVDPAKPTYDALVAVYMGMVTNRGKKSLLADVKHPNSQEIVRRLVEWADVVLCNQVPSQLTLLGLTDEQLKAINPRVILMRFDAFGGPTWGPNSDHVGYDDLLQASTGIMERFGGGLDKPEEHAHLGTIDVVSGFSGALATNLALFKRLRTGQSDLARTSLAANAQLIQTPFMIEVAPQTSSLQAPYREDRSQPAEARGPAVMGDNALYMFYETNDGHIFLAAPFVEPKRHAAASNLAEALRLDVDVLGPPPRPRWVRDQVCLRFQRLVARALINAQHMCADCKSGGAVHVATTSAGYQPSHPHSNVSTP